MKKPITPSEYRKRITDQIKVPTIKLRGSKDHLFKKRLRALKEANESPTVDFNPEELAKMQWALQNKMIPMMQKLADVYKDMKWIESDDWGKWDIQDDALVERNKRNHGSKGLKLSAMVKEFQSRNRRRVNEEVHEELGNDFKVVRPSSNLNWRSYLTSGKRPFYPKNVISLVWNYEVSDEAKKNKELDLLQQYPNRQVYWLNIPLVTIASLE